MNDIFSILKNMDKETLEKGLQQAQAFLATEEGKNVAKMLSEGKMPDGNNIPPELKDAANAIKEDKNAQSMLGEFLKKKTPYQN